MYIRLVYLGNIHRVSIILVFMSLFFLLSCGRDIESSMDTYGHMPDFSVKDQYGLDFERNDMIGKVVLIDFIYTNCTDSCSVLSSRMKDVQQSIKKIDEGNSDVFLLSFSVDASRDSPDVLLSYAGKYNNNKQNWKFLTGSQEIIADVAKDLKLPFYDTVVNKEHIHEDGSVHFHEYEIRHSDRILLVDKSGMIRRYYDPIGQWNIEDVVADVQYLLR